MTKNLHAFTLVELLIVLAILGIIATIGLGSFFNSQLRGRDAQRKSDLKQLSEALELYFSDYNRYPQASANGEILGCPYDVSTNTGQICVWGEGEFKDVSGTTERNVYMKVIPQDPTPNGRTYVYRVSSARDKFRLFGRLENDEDQDIISGLTESCGTSGVCNFAVFSTNTTPTESW